MAFGSNIFSGHFRPKPLPGTALYSSTTNRSGPVLKYDDQSGNLFTEEVFQSSVALLEFLDQPNYQERRLLFKRYPRTNFKKKENTLFNLSRKVVFDHVDSLTPDVLAGLDWFYGQRIWEDLIDCKADSFNIFKNFCEAYGNEPDFNPGNRELCRIDSAIPESRQLKLPMSEGMPWTPLYIPYLDSKSGTFLVNLTIGGRFDILELTELHGMSNLVSLALHFPSEANQRSITTVFKSWVTNKSSFQKLRVIRLEGLCEAGLTNGSGTLGVLSGLPSLKLIELRMIPRVRGYSTLQACALLKYGNYGLSAKEGWNFFCDGDPMCPFCSDSLQLDKDLMEAVLRNNEPGLKPHVRMYQAAAWLVGKEKNSDGKRRVIVEVKPTAGPSKGWNETVYFYRVDSTIPPLDGTHDTTERKRKLSEDEVMEGNEPPKRREKKAYKAKTNKKQNIVVLLNSFT
ncbi:hypothetical protein ABW19_dt0200972 [Dactylella cylindrospora]|nr:hypothetical protein ABW19_dt0200972 [Dactylella cylindrospora]